MQESRPNGDVSALGEDFQVVLFIMLYKVVLTFEPVDEILKWDYSNESYWPVLSCVVVLFVEQPCENAVL